MRVLRVKKLYSDALLPRRATPGSTGLDLHAYIEGDGEITLETLPKVVGTGIAVEVPQGYDAQIRPRSGLSARGIAVPLGTLDADYRGELKVTMYLVSSDIEFSVKHGERIAQLVISRAEDLPIIETDQLTSTDRGTGGHGSTGI